ncbi:MAG: hypothetical protein IKK83_06680 [Clostridia bacterium]|nr:hypothetical protein [Clostridia bacterium]
MNDSDPGAASFDCFGIFVQHGESRPSVYTVYSCMGLGKYAQSLLPAYD